MLQRGCGLQRRPQRSIRLDFCVALAPLSRSSPERSSPSTCNRRMSATSLSGSGDETTSANVVRNPLVSVSGSCIVRSSGTRVRIATGSPHERPRSASYVKNATEAVLFRPVCEEFVPSPLGKHCAGSISPRPGSHRRHAPKVRTLRGSDRLMGGLMAPDSGALQVLDLDVVAQPQAVAENLDLYADLHGIDAAERARQYPRLLEMTALAPFTKRHNRQRHLGFLPQDHVCERQTTMARTLTRGSCSVGDSATLVRNRRLGVRRVGRVLLDAADEVERGV